ncbi:MAG: hypothetical protein AB203_00100 [Parcubacteria bacterium C7867-008]|nr:MAG: hypothetical protein AB203_00100 [Parcubacteria bacterium C7867-008]
MVAYLEGRVEGLVYEVGDLKVEMGEVKERLGSIEVTIDKIAGGIDTLLQKNAAGAVILARHTRQIGALALHTGATLPQ